MQQTDDQTYSQLFTLVTTQRKSYICGKLNDMLPLTKLLKAELLVCPSRRKSNTA